MLCYLKGSERRLKRLCSWAFLSCWSAGAAEARPSAEAAAGAFRTGSVRTEAAWQAAASRQPAPIMINAYLFIIVLFAAGCGR